MQRNGSTSKLVQSSDGYLIPIEQEMIDRLDLGPDALVRIVESEGEIRIIPVRDEITDEEFRSAMDEIHSKYGRMLKRLAE